MSIRLILASLAIFATLSAPVRAQFRPDGATAGNGLSIVQFGQSVPMRHDAGIYHADLAPAAFVLDFPGGAPGEVAVVFGFEGLFDLIDRPAGQGLFGPGASYARYLEPDAEFFLEDPLCASASFGPGFNLLLPEHRQDNGYRVDAILPDARSRDCEAEGRLDPDLDLIGRVARLHAVVRVGDKIERLILDFPVA